MISGKGGSDILRMIDDERLKIVKMPCCDSISILNIKAIYEVIPHRSVSKGKSDVYIHKDVPVCFLVVTVLMFSEKYIYKHMKCRSLSHWLLCCHPATQLPCWAPHLLMALVTAWVQTFPIFLVINVSSPICLKMLKWGSFPLAP